MNLSKGKFYNFSDKNKINIEIIVLGTGAGRYLIPQGTNLFNFLLMSGATASGLVKDIKIVRFASEAPILKANQVFEYDYSDLYGEKEDIMLSQKNPTLMPGDMVILPEPKSGDQSIFYYIRETIAFVGTLISFYYLVDNVIRRNR